jgi:hypothetical protein
MGPHESRVLREISDHLTYSDPRLVRRLSESVQPPTSARRELAVRAVLLGWPVLGFVPLSIGLAYAHPMWVGVLTAYFGAPALMSATLWGVRRHQFVRFRDPKPP